jgi:hypothetical protein
VKSKIPGILILCVLSVVPSLAQTPTNTTSTSLQRRVRPVVFRPGTTNFIPRFLSPIRIGEPEWPDWWQPDRSRISSNASFPRELYEDGDGVEQDCALASKWNRRASWGEVEKQTDTRNRKWRVLMQLRAFHG